MAWILVAMVLGLAVPWIQGLPAGKKTAKEDSAEAEFVNKCKPNPYCKILFLFITQNIMFHCTLHYSDDCFIF